MSHRSASHADVYRNQYSDERKHYNEILCKKDQYYREREIKLEKEFSSKLLVSENKVREMHYKICAMRNEIEKLKFEINTTKGGYPNAKEIENLYLIKHVEGRDNVLSEVLDKNKQLTEERDRMKEMINVCKEKDRVCELHCEENKLLKQKNQELEFNLNTISKNYYKKNGEIVYQTDEYKKRINEIEAKLLESQNSLSKMQSKSEKMEEILKEKDHELRNYYKKNDEIVYQTDEYKKRINEIEEELLESQNSLTKMQSKYEKIKEILKEKDDKSRNYYEKNDEIVDKTDEYKKRINDIETELFESQNSLSKMQSKYEKMEQILKEKDYELRKNNEMEETIKEYKRRINKLQEKISKTEESFNNLQEENEKIKAILKDKTNELANSQEAIRHLNATIISLQEKDFSESRMNSTFSRTAENNWTTISSNQDMIDLKRENSDLKKLLEDKSDEIAHKQKAIKVMKEKINSQSNEIDIASFKKIKYENATYSSQATVIKLEKEKLRESNKELYEQVELLKKDKIKLQGELDNLKRLNFRKDDVVDVYNSDKSKGYPVWWQRHMCSD